MRNYLLTGLIIVNVVLACLIGASLFHVPVAKAQPLGLSGSFLMVNGSTVGLPNDVVYLVDLTNRQLSALYYDRNIQDVALIGQRDLVRDLAIQAGVGIPRPGAAPRQRRVPAPLQRP
jgi:hypothetical protein